LDGFLRSAKGRVERRYELMLWMGVRVRICRKEGPGKPDGTDIEWDISAAG
jgi:hypothetical protein